MTQEERDQVLLDLKRGQEELFKGQEERDQILLDLKTGQEELKSDLRNLSQTVAKIEVDHGQKLEILLDVVTSHNEKFESVEKILDKHENKLNKHDDEIYYLNSKVQAF